MKKVLIVNDGFPPESWGGANTIALLHARELKRRGYDVRVFTTTAKKNAPLGWGIFDELPVYTFFTSYPYRWWAYKSLYNREIVGSFEKELQAFAPDVVHFHNIHHAFSYHCITIAKKSGAKVFLTTHDVMSFAYQKLHHFIDYSSKEIPKTFNYHVPWWVNLRDARKRFNPLRNLIIRRYLRQVDQVFAVSDALKQALADNGIRGNVTTVHNGIDVEKFSASFDEAGFRKQLGIDGHKTVLFVGRFTPDKGRDVLLRAFAGVVQEIPTARLLVVGYDPKLQPEPGLEKLLGELFIHNKVIFVASSPHDEIYKFYRVSDVVVVPSIIFDSFPTVNLEAMAAGKPVVTTCFGGSQEAVKDEVTGYIVNPLDIKIMAQKILTLFVSQVLARTMGDATLNRLKENFSLEKQVNSYIGSYF